jgi:hypothetical protein
MLIGRAAQERYRSALGRVQKDAERYVRRRLASEARGLPVAEAREAAVGILGDAVDVFGDTAQALSARLFDEICEAEGIDAASRMFDGVIDPGAMEDKVRYYASRIAADEPDWGSFEGATSRLGGYYARRSAYENTVRNCDRGGVRYARVPGGGETCGFCLMLAGRGFVYHSEVTARGSHGVHRNCDCVVVPGRRGRTSIEGYDPAACRRLRERLLDVDGYDIPPAQREALKAACSDSSEGTGIGRAADLAERVRRGLDSAWEAYERGEGSYDDTVGSLLRRLGKALGHDLSGLADGTHPDVARVLSRTS